MLLMLLHGCNQSDAESPQPEPHGKSAASTAPAPKPAPPKPLDREVARRSAERVLEELPDALPKDFPLPKPWRLLSQTERISGGPSRQVHFDLFWQSGADKAFRAIRKSLDGKIELIGSVSYSAVYGPNFLVDVNKPRAGDKHLFITVQRRDEFAKLPAWTGACREIALSPDPNSATNIAAGKPLAPGQSYAVGDTIIHPTWDPGRVVAVDESTVTIAIPPEEPGGGPFVLACAR